MLDNSWFLRVTHDFSTVNASGTPPGSPMNIFGVNRAPGGAGEEENEFLWNCDIPGAGKGLITYLGLGLGVPRGRVPLSIQLLQDSYGTVLST